MNEATTLVDELKKKAGKQEALLSEKQAEADAALKGITQSMQVWKSTSTLHILSDTNPLERLEA